VWEWSRRPEPRRRQKYAEKGLATPREVLAKVGMLVFQRAGWVSEHPANSKWSEIEQKMAETDAVFLGEN